MRLRAPHPSSPTGDARRAFLTVAGLSANPVDSTIRPPTPRAGHIPRAALGLFIALSLAACNASGPLSKAQTDRLTSPDAAVRSSQLTQAAAARYDAQLDVFHPVVAHQGMVASEQALASQVGIDILKAGGNAIDAAVAVGFALAVVLPNAGNIGGGGFMLIHDAQKHETVAIDYREKAPKAAFRDMYLDAEGNADEERSRYHGLAVGVPGTVDGLLLALKEHGTMTREQVLAPAIRLAEEGITVTPGFSDSLQGLAERLRKWPSTAKIFYHADGSPLQPGETFKQPELAASLRRIAEQGRDGFYQGETAEKIIAAIKDAGGTMTAEDLRDYRAVKREPVRGDYRGYQIVSMPPPSSGGIHIIQILNILEGYDLRASGANTAKTIHLMAEAMQLAYADRAEYLGDPDFVKIPVKGLTSQKYADTLRDKIDPEKARPGAEIRHSDPLPYESDQTTHYSVVDKNGNAVANTYTLNFSYGTGLVADGTGILLNNEMDDFSAKPGVPNGYGLIGGDANAVEAGKRPLSSMSPTIVFKDDKPFLVTGSPGGSRIITTVLQIISNVIDHEMNIAEATHAPRIHDQWTPDEIRVEHALNADTVRLLENMGHKVARKAAMGSTQSIMVTPNGLYGASDPRIEDAATLGY